MCDLTQSTVTLKTDMQDTIASHTSRYAAAKGMLVQRIFSFPLDAMLCSH